MVEQAAVDVSGKTGNNPLDTLHLYKRRDWDIQKQITKVPEHNELRTEQNRIIYEIY